MSLFFALLTFVGWGVGDVFVTLAARRLGGMRAYFWIFFFAFLVSSLYLPFAPGIGLSPTLLYIVLLDALLVVSIILYYRALEIGNASLVGAVVGSSGALIVIFSYFLYHEPVSPLGWIGVFLALLGVGLVSFRIQDFSKLHPAHLIADKGLRMALIASLIWGAYFAVVKLVTLDIGWYWPHYLRLALFPLVIIYARVSRQSLAIPTLKTLIWVVAASLLFTVADFSYNIGVLSGFVTVVAPIATASPVLFVILSRFVFKDRLTGLQGVGMVVTLVGILILAFNS